jgi:heme-degrading monooxygenase HmoA
MWAQLITMRLKDGGEGGLSSVMQQLREIEQPDSGLMRTTVFRDQHDPSRVMTLVVFDSEERARAREADPRRQEGLEGVRSAMADVFEGTPEFVDLLVVDDVTP